MRTARALGLLSAALVLTSLPLAAQEQPQADYPAVKRVVLYKHGVGYFERWAQVKGSAELKLRFPESQMPDVLKTLFAVDLDGGRIRSIDYDSKAPLSQRLKSIRLDVPPDRALSKFLGSLKGAPIRFDYAGRQLTGRIMGTEPYRLQTEDGTESRPRLVVLLDDGTIKAVDLFEASGLKIMDESLSADLDRLLGILLRTKQLDLKQVTVQATGPDKNRRVRLGYLIEAPIWKTSYRLVSGLGDKPLLQGWAIVENPSEEDWDEVSMTFVSGNPLSFVLDLYTSFYPPRPVLDVAVVAARPSRSIARKAMEAPDEVGRARYGEALEKLARAEGRGATTGGTREDYQKSAAPIAEGQTVGEMFAYQATEKVSIPAGRAAMVPILLHELDDAREVLLYRRAFSDTPAHAIWLTNTTGNTLETGPITFFEDGTAQGEGLLPRILKPGMDEIVPYALEPGVTVEVVVDGETKPVHRGRISGGVLYLYYGYVRTTSYRIDNETQTERLLVLDHARASGYELTEPKDQATRVTGYDRFELTLEPATEQDFTVRERQERRRSVRLLRTSLDQVSLYLQAPYLSAKAREFLEQIVAERTRLMDLDRRMQLLADERGDLVTLGERVRSNVRVLGDSPRERELRTRFLKELQAAEARLEEIRLELLELARNKADLQKKLATMVKKFQD